jgi:hypothetical protein
MKKSIVISIICLLIGVGITPAIAIETDNQIEVECETVDNINLKRTKVLIDRLEDFTSSILLLSKRNPIVYEKCLELSNEVNTISEKYEELSYTVDWEYPIWCAVNEWLYYSILKTLGKLDVIIEYLHEAFIGIFLYGLFSWIRVFVTIWGASVEQNLYGFGCWDYP